MATKYDLDITQGTRYYIRMAAQNDDGSIINLSGYSISGQVRHKYGSSGTLLNLPLARVSNFYVSGYIDLDIPATTTAALPAPIQAVYDIEIHSGSYQSQLIYGYFNVYPEVTR